MQSFMVSLLGLVLSVSVGAEPLLKGRVWLASGPPAAGVQVRLFDLTDLRRSVGTTTDEAGYFALPLATVGGPALPQDFALGQNYPNPFNPSTIIPYQLPTTTHVRLEVFNLLGQRLATLVDGERSAGAHTAHWDATDAAGRAVGAGVYIYRLTGGGHTVSRRMVLIDGQAGMPAGGPGPMQPAAVDVKTAGSVYGLTVAGTGLIAYVDPAFRVGTDRVDVVLEQPGGPARMKVATGGILGDVNNDSQVDAFDVLYVALYSENPSITLPNNGDISLGDVNRDDTVDLADALLLALYDVNPSDPTLPPGIGQPADGSGDDHGNTRSAATALAVGGSRSGQIETGGDVDYFRVQVSASGDLTVHTTGSLDTKGQLEDSAGGVLARDDDGGDGYNFRIAHAVSAGTYYIKVVGYNASTTGRYTIHASGPGGGSGPDLIVASASVSDNTLTPAQSFTLNATVRNQGTAAAVATTVDYYQSPDATITADDSQVGTDTVSGLSADHTSAVSIDLTAPSSAGTYYYGACVQSVDDESNTDNNCSTGVQVTVGDGSGDDHGDTPSSATALAVGSSRSGQIETGGDVDYFRVQVSASGDLTVHTTGSLDTKGQLEDSAGAVLARDDDGGDGYNFRLAHAVSAGTYYIKVVGYNASATGRYTIHASLTESLSRIYWTDWSRETIQRANLDGSEVETLVTGLRTPRDITLDVASGKMYWTDYELSADAAADESGTIQRANLDGSEVETLVSGLRNGLRSIALDVASGKMYWGSYDGIQRANLDGSNIETLVTAFGSGGRGLALDVASGKMYWTNWARDIIQRANLDGSNIETLVTGLDDPDGIALDVASGKMYWTDDEYSEDESGVIQRANLDGTNIETLVTGLDDPDGIALYLANDKLYWTQYSGTYEGINRANLDGSNIENLISGLGLPGGIALGP